MKFTSDTYPKLPRKDEDSITNIRLRLLKSINLPLDIQEASNSVIVVLNSPRIRSFTFHKTISISKLLSTPKSFFPSNRTASSNTRTHSHTVSEINSNFSCSLKSPCSDSIKLEIKEEKKERELSSSPSPKNEFINALNYLKKVALGNKNYNSSLKLTLEEKNLKRSLFKGDSLTIIRQMRAVEKSAIRESKAQAIKISKEATKRTKKRFTKKRSTVPGNYTFKIALERILFEPLIAN